MTAAINKKPVVVRKYRAGERARRKFIAAAMRLVAEQGVQGMSLRTLNLEAGAKNHSAVHYHFGTKNDVLEAALRQVFEVVTQGQDPLFAVLEERLRDRESISVRDVVEAMYLPYVLLLFAPDHGFVAAKFVQRVVVGSDAEFQAVIQRYIEPIITRALPLLEAARPSLPPPVLKSRVLVTMHTVINSVGDTPALVSALTGPQSEEAPMVLIHRLFEMVTASIEAPYTHMGSQFERSVLTTLQQVSSDMGQP